MEQMKPSSAKQENLGVKIEDVSLFGAKLREARTKAGISRNSLAESLRLRVSSIQNWEESIAFPKQERIPEIANVYGINPEELAEYWRISKEEHEKEKEAKRPPKTTKIPTGEMTYHTYPPGKNSKNVRRNGSL